jgi:hypothetical protein
MNDTRVVGGGRRVARHWPCHQASGNGRLLGHRHRDCSSGIKPDSQLRLEEAWFRAGILTRLPTTHVHSFVK